MVLLFRDLLKRKKLVSLVGMVIKSIVPGEVTMNGPELVSTASDPVLNVVNVNSNFIAECGLVWLVQDMCWAWGCKQTRPELASPSWPDG